MKNLKTQVSNRINNQTYDKVKNLISTNKTWCMVRDQTTIKIFRRVKDQVMHLPHGFPQ